MDRTGAKAELRRVMLEEASAVQAAAQEIDESWIDALEVLAACQGKVVLLGLGKSGHVGRKIAASMSSLGTPAFFVHPTEAVHGDLGVIGPADVVLVLSNSGETEELLAVLPAIKALGARIITMTSRRGSALGTMADACITLPRVHEADAGNLAPTSSSTMTLAAGDALAVVLSIYKGFTPQDFGRLHPGGALGKRTRMGSMQDTQARAPGSF